MDRQVFSNVQESTFLSHLMVTWKDKCHHSECQPLPSSFPSFYCWTQCFMVWDMSLVSWGQLSQLCLLPTPCLFALGFPKQILRGEFQKFLLNNLFEKYSSMESSLSWVSPKRYPKKKQPWAIISLQSKFPIPPVSISATCKIRVWGIPVLHWIPSFLPGEG